jgi:O-antigen/teichoic acid export membrane protein
MHYIVWANAPVNIAKVGFAFVILATDQGLYSVIAVLLASYVAVAVVEWLVVLRLIVQPRGRFDLRLATRTVRHTSTFLGIDALVAVVASLNIILLSHLESERTIGLYSAAAQLLVPLVLVYQNSILSTFPLMTRRAQSGRERLTSVVERTGEVLVAIGLLVVLPLFFLAEPTLSLLYGDDFRPAADALRVMLWALLLSGLTATFGQVLYAGLAEGVNLRLVATAVVVGLVAGLVLISRYGLIGAAVSLLIVRVVDFTLHYLAASKRLPQLRLWPMIWKPLAAAACTAAYLAAVRPEGVLALVSATAVYVAALVSIATWSVGGLRELKARYLYVGAD